jgi:parallel beta-helix repeat protein
MQLARWPNRDWAKTAGVMEGKEDRFQYEGDRPARWAALDDVWVHGYWTWDWADSYARVKSIDTARREIITYPPHGVYGYSKGKRYYAFNILEELDEPGEWYLDRKSGVIYFWPPAPLGRGEAAVSLLEEPLITLDGASNVTLRGLTLEYTRGDAVDIRGGAGNRVVGCTIRNIGNVGVKVESGERHSISGCDISQTGDGAVILSGGDRPTLTPAGNSVADCDIHEFGRWVRTYTPGVYLSGVGNRVEHNRIHDSPHCAILLNGNEHHIEFNEIHHVALETHDVGAFYMGRDYTERGNMVRYNYFHHLGRGGVKPEDLVQAVYLDDCASGTLVYGNVFYRAGRGAMIGGGRDNTIENNIFVECTPSIHVDARGLGWAEFWFNGKDNTLIDRLKAMHYHKPPYSVRYPQLVSLYEDPDTAVPKGNSIVRNVSYGGRWIDFLDGMTDKIVHIQDNFISGDPGFVDAAHDNFQLRDDSPVYKLGFKPIPMEQIGPRKQRP